MVTPKAGRSKCRRLCLLSNLLCCLACCCSSKWVGPGGTPGRSGLVAGSEAAYNNVSVLHLALGSNGRASKGRPLSPVITSFANQTWADHMVIAAHYMMVHFITVLTGDISSTYNASAPITTHPYACGQDLILFGDSSGRVHALQSSTGQVSFTTLVNASYSKGPIDELACDEGDVFVIRSDYLYRFNLYQCQSSAGSCSPAGDPLFVGTGAAITVAEEMGAPRTVWVIAPALNNSVLQIGVLPTALSHVASFAVPRGVLENRPVYNGSKVFITAGPFLYVLQQNASQDSLDLFSQYKAAAAITSMPAIEGSTVYFSAANGDVVAVDVHRNECTSVWTSWSANHVNIFVSSVGLTGTDLVIFGSLSSAGALNKTNGKLVWQFETGTWQGYPAISMDGSVWTVSETGQLYALGLSTGRAMNMRDAAVRLAIAGNSTLASRLAAWLCAMNNSVSRIEPLNSSSDAHQLGEAVLQGCQLARNLDNGLDPSGHPGNYVYGRSFQNYQTTFDNIRDILSPIEQQQAQFDLEDFVLSSQDVADMVSSEIVQTKQWHKQVDTIDATVSAYSDQIVSMRALLMSTYSSLSASLAIVVNTIPTEVAQLEKDITKLKKEELGARIASIFLKIGGAILSVSGLGAAGGGMLQKASGYATDAYNSILQAIQHDQDALAALNAEKQDIDKLQMLAAALNCTFSAMADPTRSVDGLPTVLPQLGIADMENSKLSSYIESIAGELRHNLTGAEPAILSKVQDLVYCTETFLNYVKTWFQVAMQQQHAIAQMTTAAAQLAGIRAHVNRKLQQEVAISQARMYVHQLHQRFSQLFVKDAHDMLIQYRFWSLQPMDDDVADIISLADPASEDIAKFSLAFTQATARMTAKLVQGSSGSMGSFQYVVNQTTSPAVYAEFQENGTATVLIQPPPDLDGLVTEVRMLDVRVIPEFAGNITNDWMIFPSHAGMSFIINRTGNILNFTHEPVDFAPSDLDPLNNCPSSCSCNREASAQDLFNCQTNYVNYSPYGTWTLRTSVPKSAGKLLRLRFQFLLVYHVDPDRTSFQIFGSDNNQQHPVPAADHCSQQDEVCGWIW